jgi:hypothetical protein
MFSQKRENNSLLNAYFKHGSQSIILLWISSTYDTQNALYNSALRQGTAIRRDLDALADGSDTSPALFGTDIPNFISDHSVYDSRPN